MLSRKLPVMLKDDNNWNGTCKWKFWWESLKRWPRVESNTIYDNLKDKKEVTEGEHRRLVNNINIGNITAQKKGKLMEYIEEYKQILIIFTTFFQSSIWITQK